MNTLIALGYTMEYFEDNIALSKLFTHTIEHIFSHLRRLCYGNDKSDITIKAIAKQ